MNSLSSDWKAADAILSASSVSFSLPWQISETRKTPFSPRYERSKSSRRVQIPDNHQVRKEHQGNRDVICLCALRVLCGSFGKLLKKLRGTSAELSIYTQVATAPRSQRVGSARLVIRGWLPATPQRTARRQLVVRWAAPASVRDAGRILSHLWGEIQTVSPHRRTRTAS